jgi:eukaryotic-like serine/threonine-protein kinase
MGTRYMAPGEVLCSGSGCRRPRGPPRARMSRRRMRPIARILALGRVGTEDDKKGNPLAGTVDVLLRAMAQADSAPPGENLIGGTLAHYRIEAKLGRGGMGVVYRARDTRLDRDVALKLLPSAFAGDGERRSRLLREAKSAAAVNHSNIAAVYDVGESEGRVWLAMEFVDGTTLRERLARGALPAGEAVRIARAIATGLARAHEKGIVHRDLKPENVMLAADGAVKILDFGLAKLHEPDSTDSALQRQETQTLEGRVMGTPGYMSPEQASGRPVDARTDVYALGVVLHEMLTGGLPGIDKGRNQIRDHRLESIVARCLSSSAAQRWRDASLVLVALEGLGETPRPTGWAPRRAAWWSAGVLAVVAAGALIVTRATRRFELHGAPPSAVASGAPTATTYVDYPLPASTVPEAITEYKAGMQLVRDDAYGVALKHFARAAQLDPAMAAAHLRVAMVGDSGGSRDVTRSEFEKALMHRTELGEHERILLDALEPFLGRTHPEPAEALARLRAAAELHPTDVEILEWLTFRELNDPERAVALAHRVVELDPIDAGGWQLLGNAQAALGDLDGARASLERCASVSAESVDCYSWLADLDASQGRCERMEADGRRVADLNPWSGFGLVTDARLALDRSDEAVRDAWDKVLATTSPDGIVWAKASLSTRLAVRRGDFEATRRSLDDQERALKASPSLDNEWQPNLQLARARVDLSRETGDDARGSAAARQYLDHVDLLTETSWTFAVADWPWWAWVVGGRPLDPQRREWAEKQLREGVLVPSVWLSAWAEPAQTADDARAALDVLARDTRLKLPKGGENLFALPLADATAGHVFLLAGRPQDATPYLRRAVSNCRVLANPFAYVRARLDLGLALEQTGDTKSACAAYAEVLSRWGHATPRSVSAEAARDGVKRLHCSQ